MIKRALKVIGTLLGIGILCWWSFWRYQLLSGSMHGVNGTCSGRFDCSSGLCLSHARAPDGRLRRVDGYCSIGCAADKDCAAGLRCEPRPPELSRSTGDTLPYLVVPSRLCLRTVDEAALPQKKN